MIRPDADLGERQPDRPPPRRLTLVWPPADGEAFRSWFFRLVEAQPERLTQQRGDPAQEVQRQQALGLLQTLNPPAAPY